MRLLLLTSICVAALPLSILAKGAAKPGGAAASPKAPPSPASVAALAAAKPFDRNLNGRIDGDEIEALRQSFNAHPDGPLKPYDLNKDNKLDDVEIDAIRFPTETAKKDKKKKSSPLKN